MYRDRIDSCTDHLARDNCNIRESEHKRGPGEEDRGDRPPASIIYSGSSGTGCTRDRFDSCHPDLRPCHGIHSDDYGRGGGGYYWLWHRFGVVVEAMEAWHTITKQPINLTAADLR